MLLDLKRTSAGDFTGRLTSQSGVPVSDVVKKLPELAQVMRFREIVVTPLPEGRGLIEFRRSNPLARVVKPADLKKPPKGHVSVGVRNDGSPAALRVLDGKGKSVFTPLLVGATTGGGKSGFLHALVGGLIAAEVPVRLWVYDPKGGVELSAYERHLEQTANPLFSVARYVTDPRECTTLLKDMDTARRERLGRQRTRDHAPTVDEPLELFVCDEYTGLSDSQRKKDSYLHLILAQGRASGFSVVCLTQLTEKENIGPLRELFDQRVVLRTKTPEQTKAILGSQEATTYAPAHTIPKNAPGTFYMDADGEIIKGRVAWYDDDAVDAVAQGLLPRGMKSLAEQPERKCAVYRFYSWDAAHQGRRLEYIGKAFDPADRYKEHARDAREHKDGKDDWWPLVQRFRQMDAEDGQEAHFAVTWHDSEAEALAREREAIERELPARNELHNGKNPLKVRRLRSVPVEDAA